MRGNPEEADPDAVLSAILNPQTELERHQAMRAAIEMVPSLSKADTERLIKDLADLNATALQAGKSRVWMMTAPLLRNLKAALAKRGE